MTETENMNEHTQLLETLKEAVDYAIAFKDKLEGLNELITASGMDEETAKIYRGYVEGDAQGMILAVTTTMGAYTAYMEKLTKTFQQES
ncbi:MAG: hypothetical protein GY701_28920 [Sulfitobacter sp.]|nr:hypothetical protein [Sulfitobacter sp.]